MGLTKVTYSMIEGASVNVLDFGATGDGTTDDTAAIQAAIDYAASLENGGSVVIPQTDAYYSVGRLDARSNVTVIVPNRATRIVCENGSGSWEAKACWSFGGYGAEFLTLPSYNINAINIGDKTVTFTTSAQSSNFVVGDIIWVETVENYTVGTYSVPVFYQMNVVTNSSAGVVTLAYPIQGTYSNCRARRLNRTGVTSPVTGLELDAIRNFKLIGGTWENAHYEGGFGVTGGLIDGEISPDEVIAGFGCLYGNGFAHTTVNVKTSKITKTPIATAFSHNNTINNDSISVELTSAVDRMIELSESCRDSKVTVNTLTIDSSVTTIVDIIASRRNEVNVNSVICPTISEAVVRIWAPAYAVYTGYAQTTDNIVNVNNVHCTNVLFPVEYTSSASPFTYCQDNQVTVNLNASYISSAPLASPAYGAQSNITNAKSLSYWQAKSIDFYQNGQNVTQAQPFSKTFSFPAGTLFAGDKLLMSLVGIGGGTGAGTKTVTITFGGNTVYTGTIPIGSPIPFDIQPEIYISANTAAVGNTTAIINTSCSANQFGVVGFNFATTAYDLVISVTCAAGGGDLIDLREISMTFSRPHSTPE